MAEYEDESISPTVKKILDEFITNLRADDEIDNQAVNRLDELLRNGKLPKFDDIDEALFPPHKEDKP
jgi:hypothetical protein